MEKEHLPGLIQDYKTIASHETTTLTAPATAQTTFSSYVGYGVAP